MIKIFHRKGALVKNQIAGILPGTKQVNLNTKNLTAGTYLLVIEWKNGQTKKTVQVIKQ